MKFLNTFKPYLLATTIALALPLVANAEHADKSNQGKHCKHQSMHHKGDKLGYMGIPPHLAGLNLSQDQQDKVFAIFYPQMPKIRDLRKQEMQLKDELRMLSQSDRFDETKARQIADKLATLEKEQALNRAKIEQQVFSVLTPEQRKTLQERKHGDNQAVQALPTNYRRHLHGQHHARS
jgi:periplasmic protein CpxP/Spy